MLTSLPCLRAGLPGFGETKGAMVSFASIRWGLEGGGLAQRMLVLTVLSCTSLALANAPQNITAGEIALLPSYCADAQDFERLGTPNSPTARQSKWVAAMGPTFWHIHHYCWALVSAHRAAAGVGPQQRRFLLYRAISDCYYVIRLAPREFPLLPEIHWRVGKYQAESDNLVEALQSFELARQIRPDYWPAYLSMAEIQVSLRRQQAAVDILKAGLLVTPNEPNLVAALKRVQGPRSTEAIKPLGARKPTLAASSALPLR